MERDVFVDMMTNQFDVIVALNRAKGHDYAGDDDALSNFKTSAEPLGLTPEQVWAIYAGKHWAAILTYCKEGKVDSEGIEGRILDLILYGFLLMGLVKEKSE